MFLENHSVQNLSWSCLSECSGPGEFVVTAGWGVTGFQKGLSPTLMMLQVINFSLWKVLQLLTALVLTKLPMVMSQLNITSVEELFIYTGVFTMGKVWKRNSTTIITIITVLKITDPCYGDSGGPLAIWRAGHWQLVGVLEVFLYFFFADFFLKGRGIQLRDKRDERRWKLEQCGHSEGNWLRLPKIAHWLPIDCPLIDQLNLFIICLSKGLDSRPAWAGTPDRWIHISANFETDFNKMFWYCSTISDLSIF